MSLKNADFLPEDVRLSKEIEETREKLAQAQSRRREIQALQTAQRIYLQVQHGHGMQSQIQKQPVLGCGRASATGLELYATQLIFKLSNNKSRQPEGWQST
jgi:hypothetical protein